MEDCLDNIKQWMAWNSLCMNDGKTQYLPIAPKAAAALVDGSVIRVGVSTITASRCVRNIGVFIDRHLVMKKHLWHLCGTLYLTLLKHVTLSPALNVD